MRTWIGTLGRVGMVAVAVLLIGGCLAAPAAAEQRPEAKEANDFVAFCFGAGGDPTVFTYPDNTIIVVCADLPGGGDFVCEFVGNGRFCYVKGPGDLGGVRPTQPVEGVFVEEEPTQVTPPANPPAAAPVVNQNDDQVSESKQKKKQAKKGKKGKKGTGKHGKPKPRGRAGR